MKNGFKFHILYYVIAFICVFTGYFKDFLWISILIIIHELGHVTAAILLRYQIDRVVILPFGGMTLLNDRINRPIIEEFLILISGPLYQQLFYLILKSLGFMHPTFKLYHYTLLFFNLLPILPLDGSKAVSLFLERIFSYKKSKYICFLISLIGLFLFFLYSLNRKNLFFILVCFFLIQQQYRYIKEIPYVFSKFLYERYLYHWEFKKRKKIKGFSFNQMKRGYQHIFYIQNRWYSEKEVLKNYYERQSRALFH